MQAHLVKSRVVLSGLTPVMWTERHSATINRFINDTLQQILLLYIDKQSGLTLCTSLPTFPVEEVAYFAREENADINEENFVRVVQFGTVQGNYVNGLLRAMHDLYAPTFFENKIWPDSILHSIYYNSIEEGIALEEESHQVLCGLHNF